MYAEIIPQIKTPRSISVFDYKIPDNLDIKSGDLVEVEFRKTKIIGLVYRTKKTSNIKYLKSINKKINDVQFNDVQVQLVDWLAKYYFISPTLAFKTIFPDIPKKTRENIKDKSLYSQKISINKKDIPKISETLNKIYQDFQDSQDKNKKPKIFHYSDINKKTAIISGLLSKIKGQVIIVVPEIKDIFIYINNLPINLKNQTGYIYSGLSKNQIFNQYKNFQNNKTKILIGTKKAIFFISKNTKTLIIDDEENKSHKNYDQNPRYHVSDIAIKINKINPDIKLLFTSEAPSITNYHKFPKIELLEKNTNIQIIDMDQEKDGGNYSYFSNELLYRLENCKKAFLLFNRKGEFKQFICKNCDNIMPLEENQASCNKCGSHDLKKSIFGIKRLKTDLEKIFQAPNSPRPLRQRSMAGGLGVIKKIIEITKDNEMPKNIDQADIIIGTDFALSYINKKDIDLFGVISIDHELAVPNFMTPERVFQKLVKIINLNKKTIIQTHSPNHPVINSAKNLDFNSFYTQELDDRKKMNYPPFGDLIKIINKKSKQEEYIKNKQDLDKFKNNDNIIIDRM
ncbi:MAG: hypothetical protein ABID45_00105 [Patescibacteria group bacterium]